jgi:glycosyltransferase involved in cell wall biosynthesis
LLFIGRIDSKSPNEDSLIYFLEKIFPIINQEIHANVNIIGVCYSRKILNLSSDKIKILGLVKDIRTYYNNSKVFIIPTRFSAGIPIKYFEASSYGLPSVVTPLICDQLNGIHNQNLLVGENPEKFSEMCIKLYSNEKIWKDIRDGAIDKIKNECSTELFQERLDNILSKSIKEKEN